jgi:SAM-dependent methyltransferase
MKPILDPASGSRMFYFDKHDPRVSFGDCRRETLTVTDRSNGRENGKRVLRIDPDEIMDFRALPFPDGAFALVVFDPPHLVRAGKKSWMAGKYGRLSDNWREDLRAGFSECFRVLRPEGTLVFKWNETQIGLREVLSLTPEKPVFGQKTGKNGFTHWLVFFKERSCHVMAMRTERQPEENE